MGFLLGKSSDSLSTFECQNQNVKFDSFPINDRSISKLLHNYQFNEKGEFSYDFDYMTETEYRSLLYMLKNRNSLKEGFLLVPIPYSEKSSSISLITGSPNKAYKFTITSAPWLKAIDEITKTELTESEYTALSVYDSNYVLLSGESYKWNGFIFEIDLSEFINDFSYKDIRRLTFVVNGMNDSPIRFFAWDYTHEDWYNIMDYYYYLDADFGDEGFYLHKQLVGSFGLPWGNDSIYSDFVNGNKVSIMVSGGVGTSVLIQYARFFTNGYWVMCNDLNIENFSNAFTGAGRTGDIKLIEI
ncbi:MAG: hypothetical protein ABIL22_04235 [candidate division WOR-3 bacterium]